MSLDIEKLDVWYVPVPGQFPNGDWKPAPEYDLSAGPTLYRAHADYTEPGREPRVWFSRYPILRYTAQGVWIGQGVMKDKFVNLRAERQWACITKDEAMYGLKRRKARHQEILTWKLQMVEEINQHLNGGNDD